MFVVFEGIDGSGKTTVSNKVAERLRAEGIQVTHLRAEGKFVSAVSEAIRELGRDARNLELVPEAEFLLYVARDVQLIEQALRPALERGDVVLADRFLFTAEVLGRHGRHLPMSYVRPVLDAVAKGLVPDLVVLVDVDPTLARARRKAYKLEVADRRAPSRKGLAGVGLQHRVRQGYLDLAAEHRERWVVVDNEEALEDTLVRVTNLLLDTRKLGAGVALERFRAHGGEKVTQRPRNVPVPASAEEALRSFLRWIDARIEREPRVAAYVLGGLFGPEVDERRRALATRVPRAVLAALSGRADTTSWEIREQLIGEYPKAVATTLSGLPVEDPRARSFRERLLPEAGAEVLSSLARLDHPEVWALREQLYPQFPEVVISGLAGLDSEQAWALRQRWLDAHENERATRYELSRVALRCISGLDDARAWALREELRALAPVATLSSLARLTSARSFQWREEALTRAPKVVMGSLRGVTAPEAWELRGRVAADCKEAIDSIQDLDDPEAWELREAHCDHWPSTVVKSLGVLADGARGRALLQRQLTAHPGNISLLKHAAAIALGVHRQTNPSED